MADVKTWDESAPGNSGTPPHGYPEGMDRSDVNDADRETLAAVRRWYEDPSWIDLLDAYTVARTSDFVITAVHDTTPTDATGKFDVGSRVKVSIAGASAVYGYVTIASYGSPTTTVTLDLDGASVVPVGADRCEIMSARMAIGKAAFSPIGTTLLQDPPELPSIDDLGDGATLDMGEGEGFDADLLDGQHGSYYLDRADGIRQSLLVNPEFSIWQRGLVIDQSSPVYLNDNGAYCADQWISLQGEAGNRPAGGSGVVDMTRASGADEAGSAIQITGNASVGSPNERIGIWQPLEADVSHWLRGKDVSLSFWAKKSGGSAFDNLQCAIIEWTGTADTFLSLDPISNWPAVGAEPTVKANFSILSSVGADGPFLLGTGWTEFKLEDIAVSSACNNLGVMIWADDDSWAAGADFSVTGVNLVVGEVALNYQQRAVAEEWIRCKRFFQSSFEVDAIPQQNIGSTDGTLRAIGINDKMLFEWQLPVPLRVDPTATVYNPLSASADVYNEDQPGTNPSVVSSHYNARCAHVRGSSITISDADRGSVHLTLDASL